MAYHIGYPDEVAHVRRSRSTRRRSRANALAGRTRRARRASSRRSASRVDRDEWDMTRADGQRVLRPDAQRDGVPGRHPAAAVLQRRSLDRGEPRRHRHGRRPRAHARLRRSGRAVRRRRQPHELVAARDREAVQAAHAVRGRPVRRVRAVAGAKLNGKLTLGENIADIGGVKLAFTAYRALRATAPDTSSPTASPRISSSSSASARPGARRRAPSTSRCSPAIDPHSPPKWRVNGTLAATPDFAKAFRCKARSKMRPKNACVVW